VKQRVRYLPAQLSLYVVRDGSYTVSALGELADKIADGLSIGDVALGGSLKSSSRLNAVVYEWLGETKVKDVPVREDELPCVWSTDLIQVAAATIIAYLVVV
jgi:hypothetical protein